MKILLLLDNNTSEANGLLPSKLWLRYIIHGSTVSRLQSMTDHHYVDMLALHLQMPNKTPQSSKSMNSEASSSRSQPDEEEAQVLTVLGHYKGHVVAVRNVNKENIVLHRKDLIELKAVRWVTSGLRQPSLRMRVGLVQRCFLLSWVVPLYGGVHSSILPVLIFVLIVVVLHLSQI